MHGMAKRVWLRRGAPDRPGAATARKLQRQRQAKRREQLDYDRGKARPRVGTGVKTCTMVILNAGS